MKKLISILLAAVLIASVFAGCGKKQRSEILLGEEKHSQ